MDPEEPAMKDEGRTPYRTITTSRFLFAAAGGLLLGIYFLYLGGQNTKFWINHGAFRNLMENLGGLLIVAAGLGVVWELFGKRAFAREVLETARVAAQIETTGLKKIGVQWVDDAGWNELFGGVKKLDIFVTYASTWRRSNLARLQSAANRRGDEFASSSQILMTIGQCNHLRRAS